MRRSSRTLALLAVGWVLAISVLAMVLLASSDALWTISHDQKHASMVWGLLGTIIVAGLGLIGVVHGYVRVALAEGAADS